jgi:hypothetical protein
MALRAMSRTGSVRDYWCLPHIDGAGLLLGAVHPGADHPNATSPRMPITVSPPTQMQSPSRST